MGYPASPSATFHVFIDALRCTSAADGRRCQLWHGHDIDHDIDHAAAWSDGWRPIRGGHRGAMTQRWRWQRWTTPEDVREQQPGSERLPWACMGSP